MQRLLTAESSAIDALGTGAASGRLGLTPARFGVLAELCSHKNSSASAWRGVSQRLPSSLTGSGTMKEQSESDHQHQLQLQTAIIVHLSPLQHDAAQHSTAQRSTAQHSTAQPSQQ